MDKDKYPELAKQYDELEKKRNAILAKTKPLDEKAEKLRVEVDKATAAWRKVREETAAIEEAGHLREISMEMAALARAMGARSMKAEA